MKKALLFIAVSFLTISITAQINFSGSWKLNASKSKLGDQFSMAPQEIIAIQNGNDLSLEKHIDFQGQTITVTDKLTLDGKECINAGFMDSKKKSTATWSSDNTSLKIDSKIPMQDGGEVSVTETYKLDSENLVIEMSASSSYGEMTEIQVYEKK